MKESDIRDNQILQRYQKLVDKDVKDFFSSKKNFKKINYKSWGCKKVKKIFKKKTSIIFSVYIPTQSLLIRAQNLNYWKNFIQTPSLQIIGSISSFYLNLKLEKIR